VTDETFKEFDPFTSLVDQVLAVPHSVIQERVEEAHKIYLAANHSDSVRK
jgi:hypothetical protein